MGDVVVRHGKNGDLSDGAISALHTTSSLVDSRQIGIHVTGITTAAGDFFSGSRDFSEGIAVRRDIGQNNEDVLLELVGIIFGSGEGETGSNNTLDAVLKC